MHDYIYLSCDKRWSLRFFFLIRYYIGGFAWPWYLKCTRSLLKQIKINFRSHFYLRNTMIDFMFHWNTKCNFIWKSLGWQNISISYVFIRLSCHRNHYDTSRYDLKKKPKNLIDVHKYWKKSTIQKLDQDNILKF